MKLRVTHGTQYFIARALVLAVTSKTFETEGVITWQRLWVVEHFQTNGARHQFFDL